MEKYLAIIAEKAEAEFEEFKKSWLEKNKEEIFNGSYIISFYTEMKEFLLSEFPGYIEDENVAAITKFDTNFIACMYDYYCNNEYASISTWDDILDFIRDYFDSYELE